MASPSVRSTSRNTPCVLGCCGPMLTSISSVRTSNSMTVGSGAVTVAMQSPGIVEDRSATADAVVFQRVFVVLAQRMADPVVGQKDARQVRVAGEPDAGQVVDLAFVPV